VRLLSLLPYTVSQATGRMNWFIYISGSLYVECLWTEECLYTVLFTVSYGIIFIVRYFFRNIPCVIFYCIFQSSATIVLFFPVSVFTFLSAFSSPGVEEKSMNYETGYFHHHTVQLFSSSIDKERRRQFSEKFSVNCPDRYDLGVFRTKGKGAGQHPF
jgi:hypothetical protein